MANIKKITLPTGTTYDIVDQGARDLIDALSGYTVFLGVTTTVLTDGSTTNPITINGSSITATTGGIATYGNAEFIWNGEAWQEFGDLGALGDLAYKDTASGSFTPSGTVSQPSFTGTAGNISASFTPEGSVTISTGTGSANYTPSGSIAVNAPTVTLNTTTVNSITDVGTLPSCTMPVLTTSVSNETLTIGWTAGSYTAGTLPTKGSDTTVATGVDAVTSNGGTFTGNGAELKATFSGTAGSATGTFTPSGTVSQPTFSGTGGTVTVS